MISRVCAIALCVALSGVLAVQPEVSARQGVAATQNSQDANFFPVAVWYSGGKARAPMLERVDATSASRWGRDLDQIKSLGFNTVKTWVDWATAEPLAGQYRFQNLELLLKLAEERGLRVIVQIYLDSAPDWVGEKYPDGKYVERGGAVIESQAAPGFCIDHAGVRAEIVKFLEALSARANRSPALYGWDVWSEPHVINWAEFPSLPNPEFCFCPSTQARFREHLKKKYATLDALNAAWYRNFVRWEQVSPPRGSTILSYTDYIDWREFIPVKLAGDLSTRVEAIRSADRGHPITSHAAVPGIFTSPTYGMGSPDDWLMASNADFFGTSIYPKHAASVRPWPQTQLSAALDFTRSSGRSFGKGFWIGELQAGQGVTGMRIQEPVLENDVANWMWRVLSFGARKIAIYAYYPMSSGYESNGYGLIELDGTVTARARAAGRVAKIIQENAAELMAAKPAPAEVAILYNRLSAMVGGAQPSLSRLGNATRDSMMGLHRAFNEAHIPVDFVSPSDAVNDKLTQYKILFLPFPVMLSKDVAEGVKRYVANGGVVVSEARPAWNDERGFSSDIVPGAGLHEMFGARETLMRPVEKATLMVEGSTEPVIGEAFEEELQPMAGARVLARFSNGAPAITENKHGLGRAILVGTFLGLAYQRQGLESTQRLLLQFARDAHVADQVTVTSAKAGEIEVRRLVDSRRQLVFVFNQGTGENECSVSFPVGGSEAAQNTLGVPILPTATNLATGGRVSYDWQKDIATLKLRLGPGEAVVLRFSK